MPPPDRTTAELFSQLTFANPFSPERVTLENRLLGLPARARSNWNVQAHDSATLAKLRDLAETTLRSFRRTLINTAKPAARDVALYDDLLVYVLFNRHETALEAIPASPRPLTFLLRTMREELTDLSLPNASHPPVTAEVLLSTAYQIRRAFAEIFTAVIGTSAPAARLRAAIWESIFTHDLRRYRRALQGRTNDLTTLIIGESGTGKELVARAIARSAYLPLSPSAATFPHHPDDLFLPLNLSALSPTLIESELFGHRRGAFTGAISDRKGYLELCPEGGAIFLDEIGELDPAIQVKLLRVLQSREFQRIGDTKPLRFRGKIIAATNRNLATEVAAGRFRRDLYYRLCSDLITTPTLRDSIADDAAELPRLLNHIAHTLLPETEAADFARQAHAALRQSPGPRHSWPGNFRELEQAARNILIRGHYSPLPAPTPSVTSDFDSGILTADELLNRYTAHVYARERSYEATARILKLDRRTVKARVLAAQQKDPAK